MADKTGLYKRIKIAGILSFIPFVLAGGVVAGYFAGEYLQKKFFLPSLVVPACIGIGLLASALEVIRIIKLALNLDKKG